MGEVTEPVILADDTTWLRLEEASGVGTTRRAATALGTRLGLSQSRRDELAIVVTELATNIVNHVGHGTIVLRPALEIVGPGIDVLSIDDGPGIRAVRAAVRDGTSTAGTLGVGLGAVVRLADRCDVYTQRGIGTVVLVTISEQRTATAPPRTAALIRPLTGETESGDAWAIVQERGIRRLLLVDGLGHGPLAARAAQQATRTFAQLPIAATVTTVLEAIHRDLAATRGAAAAVVRIVLATGEVTFAGAGNVSTFIVGGERRETLLSAPGILGHQIRHVREITAHADAEAAVVMHSDGLSEKWSMDDYPNVLSFPPDMLAGALMRDVATRRDDAGVLVSRLS